MIRYTLKCSDGHGFDSWFQSADAFDDLMARGLVACSVCGATDVSKSIMAPGIPTKGNARSAPRDVPGDGQVPDTAMASGPLTQPGSEMEQAVRNFREKLEANSTYVGDTFAKEARDIHLGDAPERQIHGEATADEARALLEDGVPVLPLPGPPKSKTN